MGKAYSEMNWRERRAWNDENEKISPDAPVTMPLNEALENARASLAEALSCLKSEKYPPCANFDFSQSLHSAVQDLLTKISEEMLARESKGRLAHRAKLGPRDQAEYDAQWAERDVKARQWGITERLDLTTRESLPRLERFLTEYSAVYPAREMCTAIYIAQDLPILRDGVVHFKLRHLMHWLRDTHRSYVNQSDLVILLETLGFCKVSVTVHVTDITRVKQMWYWTRS
jgi:hypothetical protein